MESPQFDQEWLQQMLESLSDKLDDLDRRLHHEDAALTRAEAAAYLKCHPQTLYNWAVRDGRIPYYQTTDRGGLRFKRKDLDAFLEECRVEAMR